ncbi:uncharacterized protein LOC133711233 [Rosa rugosa]|uniref:uncharacterized protein LOC133711233 n=1 Tax=Rosa rugosa TaxID=74645 RepID=UPI002B418652|nr:uncharacterized protein LOC133711233 [Rosa rugosa]
MIQENILIWNCRGIVCNETQRALVDLVQLKKPNLIFLAETLAKPNHIEDLMHRLGFTGRACYPHEDDLQGVALLWRNDISVSVHTLSPHHIDAEIGDPGGPARYRFTGVYGFAARSDRTRTWDLIRTLNAECCDLPWLMAGDFNEILCQIDKSGGPPRAAAPMAQFRQVMADCGLTDMSFFGSRFTWLNKFTKERLDRSFQSLQCRMQYPCSRVITLPPSESDHCPILIEVRAERRRRKTVCKRFRFEEIWHGEERCTAIIQKHWSQPITGNLLFQIEQKSPLLVRNF